MKGIRQELKKQLEAYLNSWVNDEESGASTGDVVDDILNVRVFPQIAVVDREAKLPCWYKLTSQSASRLAGDFRIVTVPVQITKQDMLEVGWVKEVKDGQNTNS